MWELLSKERKILLGVTVVIFIVSATMIWQTYQTMQIYNAADDICAAIKPDTHFNELVTYARSNNTALQELSSDKLQFGFSSGTKESCGCHIIMQQDRVKHVEPTFCIAS